MESVFAKLDELQESSIQRLGVAVEIPSISSSPASRPDVFRMADFLEGEFKDLNMSCSRRYPPSLQELSIEAPHPPVLFASTSHPTSSPHLSTVLIYGHYDVQPASLSDGWAHPPFTFKHDPTTGVMRGRGVTDDKGPVLGWLSVLRAFHATSTPLPARLVFCLEGMEEVGSPGLRAVLEAELSLGPAGYLHGVTTAAISDNYWLGTKKPCLTYGLRGIVYFTLEVRNGTGKDMHSGYGGQVQEPLGDLVKLLASLTNDQGDIAVEGFKALEKPLTAEARKFYEGIEIEGLEDSKYGEDKVKRLVSGWHDSALSYHGIEGAFSGQGAKTVIPGRVVGKFSIRSQSGMDADAITPLIAAHLRGAYGQLKTKNPMAFSCLGHEPGWEADPTHWNYRAAIEAVERVWGVTPDLIREGGTIPVTSMIGEVLGKEVSVVLIPMGRGDDGAHSTDEKLDVVNFANGCKVLAWYLTIVGEVAVEHEGEVKTEK